MTGYEIFTLLFIDLKIITIPILNIALAMIFKAISLPGEINGSKLKELMNIGPELAKSGLMLLATTICVNTQQSLNTPDPVLVQLTMIVVYILLLLIYLLLLKCFGWKETKETMDTKWLVISGVIGVGLFSLAIWFIG